MMGSAPPLAGLATDQLAADITTHLLKYTNKTVLSRSNMEQKAKFMQMLRLPVKTILLCWNHLDLYKISYSFGFSQNFLDWLMLRRLEAELVEASAPHLLLAPPNVHVTWWAGFIVLMFLVKNRIKITTP